MINIKDIIKRIIGYKNPIQKLVASGHILIGKNSDVSGLKVIIRKKTDKLFLKIGDHSTVNGTFVFERENAYIEIGSNTFIGGCMLVSAEKIEIGDDVMFSWGCTVSDTDAHSTKWEERKNDVRDWKKGLDEKKEGTYKDWAYVKTKPVLIKNKCWIGFNAIVLKGVVLSEECVVGAGSVVSRSFDKASILAGNPASLIKNK